MNLFIISTAYQLLNIINICKNEDKFKNSVLIILDLSNGILNKINIEYLKTLFMDVYIGRPNMSKCRDKINKAIYCFHCLIKRKPFGIDNYNKFDNIYLSGTEMLSKIVAYKMGTKESNYYYIEDGVASYGQVLNKETKSMKDFIFKLLMGKTPLQKCKGIYVYRPEKIVNNSYHISSYKLHQIDASYEKLMKNVFVYDMKNLLGNVIFFNQWRFSKEQYEFQKTLFEVIHKEIGDACILKLHPANIQEQKQYIDNRTKITDDNTAFEIINFYHSMEKKILISVTSTACLTPFYIYGQSPYIIFLYKIYGEKFPETLDKDTEKFLDSLKNDSMYDKYVYMPEDIEELQITIQTLQKLIS